MSFGQRLANLRVGRIRRPGEEVQDKIEEARNAAEDRNPFRERTAAFMQSRVHSHHNEIHPCKIGAGTRTRVAADTEKRAMESPEPRKTVRKPNHFTKASART